MASDNASRSGSNGPSDDHNSSPAPSEISTIALSLVGTFVAVRCLAVVSRLATALAAPLAGFYLMTTCPTNESFDAKRELKRVLRGYYKSDTDPSKPKSFLEKALAKVNAAVEAEAAAFAGCNVEIVVSADFSVTTTCIIYPLAFVSHEYLSSFSPYRTYWVW